MSPTLQPLGDRTARLDLALGAACALALVGVLYAAFLEGPTQSPSTSGPVVGRLLFEENEVRRRSEGALAWQALHAREAVFDRDAVFVGGGSRAVIELEDGARIAIAEGALVVVHRPEASSSPSAPVSVELVRGTAEAQAGSGALRVRSGQTQVEATPGSKLRVQTDRRHGAQIDVSAGKAVVASRGAAPVSLAAGTRARVEAGGAPTRQRLSVALQHPEAGQTIYGTQARFEVPLEWSAPGDAAGCRAEVSDDPLFERVVARVEGEGGGPLVLSAPGTYLWRVRCGEGAAAHQSEEWVLHLVQDIPPVPLHPMADAVLLDPAPPLTLSWTEVDGALGYELELNARDGATRLETPWAPTFRIEEALAEGGWCYRVRARPEGRQTPWSRLACFQVVREGVLPAPELLEPTREPLKKGQDRRGALDLLWRVVGGVAHADTARSAIVLRWRSIPGAESYLLEIAEDPAFERKVLQEKVRHTWFKWPTVLRREYFWRVRAIDARGREGKMSEVVRLASEIVPITLQSPAAGAAVDWADRAPQIPLRWKGPKVARSYRLEVATDAGFSQVVHARDLDGSEAQFTPQWAGEFHWRVSARDLEGQPLPPSAPSSFQVVAPAPVPAAQRERLVAGASGATALFAWSERPVKAYELQVSAAPSFARLEARRIVRGQAAVRVRLASPGRFVWRVRGVEPQTQWSAVERLVIRPEPPAPVLPDEGAQLTVGAAQPKVELRWTQSASARGYELEVRAPSGERVTREATSAAATLEGLPPGQLTWRVRAVHRSGVESDWSEPRSFELLRAAVAPSVAAAPKVAAPAPPASAPPPASPAQGGAYVGLAVGWFHNLGGLQSPRGALELGWRPAAFGRRFGAALTVGYSRASSQTTAAGDLVARGTLDAVPIALMASWVVPTPAVDVVLSAGPSLGVTRAQVEVSPGERFESTRLGFGLIALAGAERRLGPGAAFVEAGWQQLPRVERLIEARPSGLCVQAGYRLGVW